MAPKDLVPGTLAQMLTRRARSQNAKQDAAPVVQDRLGQFGFSFDVAESEIAQKEAPTPLPSSTPPISAGAAPHERKLWSVAELVGVLRGKLEREYADVWVEGEISNCRPASSGHLYFTLKDGDAQLPVVLFRRQAILLRWKPEDGLAVLVRGRVSVFENRGQLQLIADSLEPRGAGALQLQFEQLKSRLRAEGLFEADRKRDLPAFPKRIGVVTSPQGAVIRDIVTVCRRRHGCIDILVYPAAVQGSGAAAEVAAGIRYFNRTVQHRVDVIVLARGGGSAEDLWSFNDEALARTIAASELPIVSAVGHETDFTIADLVADLRAPTPSAAAEIITAAQHRIAERVQALQARLLRGIRFQTVTARQHYASIAADGVLRRMRDSIERRQERLDEAIARLERASAALRRERLERLRYQNERLLRQHVGTRVANFSRERMSANVSLRRAGAALAQPGRQRLHAASLRLEALSPMAVLQRGYSLTFLPDGRLLRSSHEVAQNDDILTRLAYGTFTSRVTRPTENT